MLQRYVPLLPTTSPVNGQPLKWLDVRPLLLSTLESTKQNLANPPPHSSDYYLSKCSAKCAYLQELLSKPLFGGAAPASSTLPPASPSPSSSSGSATNSKRQIDATAERQGSPKRLKASPSPAASVSSDPGAAVAPACPAASGQVVGANSHQM